MTKINISPAWKDVKPKGFYVYLHRRATDNRVFYIGKGNLQRGFSGSGRNKKWHYTARKNGVIVEICQDDMTEGDAFLLEMWLIAKLRNADIDLSNITDGGEGAQGHTSKRRKKVYCSNGMIFSHAKEAAKWLVSIGFNNATSKSVSAACTGQKCIVYGFTWSHDETPSVPHIPEGLTAKTRNSGIVNSRRVYSSKGESFKSASDAARCLSGTSARGTHILQCCRGERKTAFNRSWSLHKNSIPKYECAHDRSTKAKFIKIKCCNGMVFGSIREATEWISVQSSRNYSASAIYQSISRGTPIASYTFERISKSRRRKKSE